MFVLFVHVFFNSYYNKEWRPEVGLTYNASRPLYVIGKADYFFGVERTSEISIEYIAKGKRIRQGGTTISGPTIWTNYTPKVIKVALILICVHIVLLIGLTIC